MDQLCLLFSRVFLIFFTTHRFFLFDRDSNSEEISVLTEFDVFNAIPQTWVDTYLNHDYNLTINYKM